MAHAGRDVLLPATIAGADALTSKAAPARELFEVRQVARGEEVLAAATREELDDALRRIPAEDLPLPGMLLGGAARVDVAAAIGVTVDEVPARIQRLLHALRPAVLQDAR